MWIQNATINKNIPENQEKNKNRVTAGFTNHNILFEMMHIAFYFV
jgi:hypothetical protein